MINLCIVFIKHNSSRRHVISETSRIALRFALLTCLTLALGTTAQAQESFRPNDPIASIDGEPVFLGELNYLLKEKLRVRSLDRVEINVQKASTALLVRRQLASNTLKKQGGASLQEILDRQWLAFQSQIGRTGQSMEDYCKQRKSDEKSVRKSVDWETSWGSYLRSKMTEANLRRFYDLNAERYASAKWDVSHLFIAIDRSDAQSERSARGRMESILAFLEESNSSPDALARRFAELAQKESDGATADKGGRIGWVSKPGDLPSSVMNAIRQTDEGNLTEVVKSPLGLHLLLVHQKKVAPVAFEQLDDVAPLRRDAADAMFDALVRANGVPQIQWFIKALEPPKGALKLPQSSAQQP